MQDQNLVCKDCGSQFIWTKGEQEFYKMKGFDNAPSRCPECRRKKKTEGRFEGKRFEIKCGKCGKSDTVPFEPRGDREVLCRDCFKAARA